MQIVVVTHSASSLPKAMSRDKSPSSDEIESALDAENSRDSAQCPVVANGNVALSAVVRRVVDDVKRRQIMRSARAKSLQRKNGFGK